jgi:hypothetical protein
MASCVVCGKDLPVRERDWWLGPPVVATYCSGKCRQKAYRARRKANPERYGPGTETRTVTQWTCALCGGPILGEAWYLSWGVACSQKCAYRFVAVHGTLSGIGREGRQCRRCGRTMYAPTRARRYCSEVCRKQASRAPARA